VSDQQLIEKILGEWHRLRLDGEDPETNKVLDAHPELTVELREELQQRLTTLALFDSALDDAEQPSPQLPETIAQYRILQEIGRGGMGVVYEAWQGSMDRRVALKVLPTGVAADSKSWTRFLREAQLMGKLNHPNVVHVHGMGVEERTPYYSMEYVEGETLAQALGRLKEADEDAETPFGVRKGDQEFFLRIARSLADVAAGLQHAHSKGVVHRDIKPSNLILDARGEIWVSDFGLARIQGEPNLTRTGDILGTPCYMSPEQARGDSKRIGEATDIYGLGVVLYECLAGQPPFHGKPLADTMHAVLHE